MQSASNRQRMPFHIPATHVLMPEYQFRLLDRGPRMAYRHGGRPMINTEISVRSSEYLWFAVSLLLLVALKGAEPLFS
jgi:hypothetical protein